jgi:hypothetical protein
MNLGEVPPILPPTILGKGSRGVGGNAPAGPLTKGFPDELPQFIVLQVPRCRNDAVIGAIVILKEGKEILSLDPGQGVHPPQNGAAQGVVGPQDLNKEIMNKVIGRVLHHLDLLEDYLLLLLQFSLLQERAQEDIREQIHG